MKAPEYTITRRENADAKATETAISGFARGLLPIIALHFKEEGNRHEFEDWYLKEYGKPYTWKTREA